MTCYDGGCWLCASDAYAEFVPFEPLTGGVHNGLDATDTADAWWDAGTPTPAVIPELTKFTLIEEYRDSKRRTSGTGGLKIQGCQNLERFGMANEGMLCLTQSGSVMNQLPRGGCYLFRYYLDRGHQLATPLPAVFFQFAGKVGSYSGLAFDIDGGEETPWSNEIECVNNATIYLPVWRP